LGDGPPSSTNLIGCGSWRVPEKAIAGNGYRGANAEAVCGEVLLQALRISHVPPEADQIGIDSLKIARWQAGAP